MGVSFPMKPKSSASFLPPIWIALRLKNLQAQNKNFCRVLDIRVAKIVEPNVPRISFGTQLPKGRGYIIGLGEIADPIDTDRSPVLFVVRAPTQLAVFLLLFLDLRQLLF